jgi:hypothetical protein
MFDPAYGGQFFMELGEHRKFSLVIIGFVLLEVGLGEGYGIIELGNKILKGILHQEQRFLPVPDTCFFQGFKGKVKIKPPREHNDGGGQDKEIKEVFPQIAPLAVAPFHPVSLP